MKEWFLSRAPRERAILAGGAVVALIIIFQAYVWRPLTNGTEELQQDVAVKSRLLVDVQRAAAIAPADEDRPARASTQSLVVLVDSTAQSHGLDGALTRTRPDGPDGINVSFQNASFDALLSWLVTLRGSYGVNVESANVSGTQTPGLVNGQVFLRRS